jgi:hypothetical protein
MKRRRSPYSHPKPFSEESNAPRRRSTPAERPSSCRRDAISRWKAASPPSLHGLSSAAGAVHKDTVGRPACGRSAWWPRRSGCRPRLRHPVHVLGQRPVSGASDQCPRLPVHGTGVQCPVRASERPGVRCPASGVGVRCLCVAASAVSRRSEVLERGGGAGSRMAGMAGVGVVVRCVHVRLVVCLSREPRARSWRRRCWASRGVGVDLAVVVGRWLGSGQLDRVADQDRPGAREDRSLVGAGARRGSPPAAG